MIEKLIRWLMKRFGKQKTMALKTAQNNDVQAVDLIENQTTVETVVEATPVVESEPVTIDVVTTPELLSIPAEPETVQAEFVVVQDVATVKDASVALEHFEILGISNNSDLSAAININGTVYATNAKTLEGLARHIETTLSKLGFKSTNHRV